jgi:hypothetical protein
MRQGKRFGLSAVQRSDLWRRWKAGQSLHEIGRAFGKSHSSIRCVVSLHGGFVPAVRRRSLELFPYSPNASRILGNIRHTTLQKRNASVEDYSHLEKLHRLPCLPKLTITL